MSLAALALATRNKLRADLTDFYDHTDEPTQTRNRAYNCRVMPDNRPAANCGQEFIAVYGGRHRPRNEHLISAIDEEMGLIVAVSLKLAVVPHDYRGEAGYVHDDQFTLGWKTIEARCREIIGLIDKNYQLLRDADTFFNADAGFSEPLVWSYSDPSPQIVYADHFQAYHSGVDSGGSLPGQPEADDEYGLLMHVHFNGAVRMQHNSKFDQRT
jgi:hypothetical protein